MQIAGHHIDGMPTTGRAPIRVLHLEDNPGDARLCLEALRTAGLSVELEVAGSGKEFREKIKAQAYDMILGDYRLPDSNGLEALQWLRKAGFTMPFILVTGTLGDDLAVECIKNGAADYVLKERLQRLPFAVRRALRERRLREKYDRAQRGLLQSERECRSIIQGAPYGIYRADHEGHVLMANPALVGMLGYETEDQLRANFEEHVFVDPEERQPLLAQAQSAALLHSEQRWRRKDRKEITVRLAGRKLPDTTGAGAVYEVFVEDITAQRQLEREFLQSQKMEAIGRLAGGVAHDFNNMLMIISGSLELWHIHQGDPEKAGQYVAQIGEAASTASFVVRQLLALSHKQVLERRVMNVNSVLEDLMKLLPRLLGEDVEVIMDRGRNLRLVQADRGHLEQLVINLAVNARDAMPKGGKLIVKTANVQLGAGRAEQISVPPGPYVALAVTDTGAGMDDGTRARIFEPFFTTKERGKGTGLGLAIVSTIMKENGGAIQVHSELGKGSTFEVYFPAASGEQNGAALPRMDVAVERGSETILVVEDDGGLRAISADYLQSLGYKVLKAANGDAAMDTCRSHGAPIHLLLTDVVMPGMSGPELAAGALRVRPEMRIVYTSGYVDRQLDRELLNPGAAFLQKPYKLADLNRKIRETLACNIEPRMMSRTGNDMAESV